MYAEHGQATWIRCVYSYINTSYKNCWQPVLLSTLKAFSSYLAFFSLSFVKVLGFSYGLRPSFNHNDMAYSFHREFVTFKHFMI